MKKVILFSLALCLVGFGALGASGASADEVALWLFNGVEVKNLLPADIVGTLVLIDLKAPFVGEARIECTGTLHGSVGPGEEDEITDVLSLTEVLIDELGGTNKLLCLGTRGCESGTEDAEVQPENLPWITLLSLMTNGLFLDLIEAHAGGGLPGYNALCLVGGLNIEDLCEGETSASLELMTGNVLLAIFNPAELAEEGLEGTCSQGGAGSADLEGTGEILDTEEVGELDVSSG